MYVTEIMREREIVCHIYYVRERERVCERVSMREREREYVRDYV